MKFECYINYDGWWRISVQCVAIVDFSTILKPAVNRNLGVNCNAKDIFLFLDGNAPQTQQSARRRGRWTRATQGCICWAVSKVILPSPPEDKCLHLLSNYSGLNTFFRAVLRRICLTKYSVLWHLNPTCSMPSYSCDSALCQGGTTVQVFKPLLRVTVLYAVPEKIRNKPCV